MTANHPADPSAERVTQWVQEHGPAVRGYLRALVRHDAEADDLAQEVFRRAWTARDSYQEQGTARSYLLRIADRLVCDRARRMRREVNLDSQAWESIEPQARTGDPIRWMGHSEAQRQLAEALDQLTPAQRRVLLLRYYGQMSFTEIAHTMNSPLNTVLSHCHRGLRTLRRILVESPL